MSSGASSRTSSARRASGSAKTRGSRSRMRTRGKMPSSSPSSWRRFERRKRVHLPRRRSCRLCVGASSCCSALPPSGVKRWRGSGQIAMRGGAGQCRAGRLHRSRHSLIKTRRRPSWNSWLTSPTRWVPSRCRCQLRLHHRSSRASVVWTTCFRLRLWCSARTAALCSRAPRSQRRRRRTPRAAVSSGPRPRASRRCPRRRARAARRRRAARGPACPRPTGRKHGAHRFQPAQRS
mmetsp:Transcript_64580/g.185745  ORF Transcript_64580/g.185745 Transcript_64580/m.185745 type:complete len:235 (+) Transcript_64580:892-1596(+)